MYTHQEHSTEAGLHICVSVEEIVIEIQMWSFMLINHKAVGYFFLKKDSPLLSREL